MAAAYTHGILQLMSGGTIWTSHIIQAILVRSGYVYASEHDSIAHLSNEVTGGGYGRVTLTGKSVVEQDDDGEARLFASNLTFVNLTTTGVIGLVIARPFIDDANSPLLFYLDFPAPINRTAQDLVVVCPANGLAGIRV